MLTRHKQFLETETITLEPLFPLTPLTPSSTCPHHGPIRTGSRFCCMICHRSGQDHRIPAPPSRRRAELEEASDRITQQARYQRLKEKPRKITYSERHENN